MSFSIKHRAWWRGVVMTLVALGSIALLPSHDASAATTPAISDTVKLNITRSNGFLHPAISVDPSQFQNTRDELAAGKQPWTTYYQGMLESPYASTTFQAANLKTGTFDTPKDATFTSFGQEDPLSADGFRAYTQAILYYLTGNSQYRYNAIRLVRIWENMDPNGFKYYADAHIHAPVPFYYLVSAAELLKYTSVTTPTYTDDQGNTVQLAWTDTDNSKLINNLIDPLTSKLLIKIKDQYLAQHLYPLTGALAGAIFKDDRAAYNDYVEQTFINANSNRPYINGAINNMFHQMTADDPRNPVGIDFIQHLEMGRDANHSKDDIFCLTGLARIINNQGTKVDPTTGTASTAANAVDPYAFGNNRLIAGAEQFYRYNSGETIPWVQVSQKGDATHPAIEADGVQNLIDFGGAVSIDGRGRLNKPYVSSEIYDYYRFQEGMTPAEIAKLYPAITTQATHLDGTTFYEGTTALNYWGAYSDSKITEIGTDYWLSMPAAKATATETFPGTISKTSDVSFSQLGTPLDTTLATRDKDGITVTAAKDQSSIKETAYDALYPKDTTTSRGGSQVALTGLVKPADGYFALKLKTNGQAKLLISSNNKPNLVYQTIALPDTHNEWITIAYPTKGGQANLDFFAVISKQNTKVTFNAGCYTDATALPVFSDNARDVALFTGKTLTQKLTATNATKLSLIDAPKGLTLAANGTMTYHATTAGTYPVILQATNQQRTITKTFTITVEDNRTQAYNNTTKTLASGVYTTASLTKLNEAADHVKALLKSGDDAAFQTALQAYADAIKQAELLNPTLKDGSLNYAAYTDLAQANLLDKTGAIDSKQTFSTSNLVDDDPASYGGDWMTPAVLDFGADYQVTITGASFLARTGFPNRTQGANLYGSNDGKTWTKLTTATTKLDNQMQSVPIAEAQQKVAYRYIKIQVDEPGPATDPAWPGIASFADIHLFGTRSEVNQGAAGLTLPALLDEPEAPATTDNKPQTGTTTPTTDDKTTTSVDSRFDHGKATITTTNKGHATGATKPTAQSDKNTTSAAAKSKRSTNTLPKTGNHKAALLTGVGMLVVVLMAAGFSLYRKRA